MNRKLLGLMATAFALCTTVSCSTPSDSTGVRLNDSAAAQARTRGPSAVTDLKASAIDGNGVTLSFTQVNDGAGQPAKYDVRYAKAPISWGSATSTTSGTCTTPLAGTAIGSQLSCTVLGLTPATNYNFQLVSFRGTLNVSVVFGGLSNVAAATTTSSTPPTTVPVASVSVAPATSSLVVGATAQLSATARDSNNNVLTGRVVAWSSSNTAAARVSTSGLVTAAAAGSATITATSEGKAGTATIRVTAAPPVPVASVTVSPTSASVQVGGTQQYSAVTRDASGNALTGRTVTWSSSNTAAATVSTTGRATAVAAGSATITATSEGRTGTATITVTAPTGSAPVFSDDFESGTMSKWNESQSSVQQVINDPASAHSGNRFLRLTYGINGGDAGWLNKYFSQGFNQVYVRYYVRFSSNFRGGTKLVGFHGAPIGNPTAGVGRAGICPNGTDSFAGLNVTQLGGGETYPTKMYTYWQDMWKDSDGRCWGRYGATPSTFPYIAQMPEFSKGVWHKVEYTLKMNSAANVADGEQRFWVDGVKYGEWKGIRFGDPTRINVGVLIISGSGDTGQIQTIDYDDLILTTDYPSQSQP